jgi:hypothetical protein
VFTPLETGISEQRLMHAAWRTRDGSVYIVGGEVSGPDAIVPLAAAMRFDVATLRFGAATGLSMARTLAVPVVGADDGVLLIGGQTVADRATGRLTRWTAAGGEQPLANLPGARVWHTANRLPDGSVLVLGGEDGSGRFAADMLMLERAQ